MALPALSPTSDQRPQNERVNRLIREFNRIGQDTFLPIYAADTGSATAYAIAPVPGITQYIVGQIFTFKAANDNSGTAPTLNVNSKGAGTITYPDGSALVPGDIKANGFYTVECTSTTPAFQLLTSTGGRSKVLQTVSTIVTGVATGTTTIPSDDTIPQSTEGDQYMSLSITPKSAVSKLYISVTLFVASTSGSGTFIAALFQDSTANALAAGVTDPGGGSTSREISFTYSMTSGTTSSTTFKVRAGNSVGGTTTFNGQAGSRLLGGVMASSIVIREELP